VDNAQHRPQRYETQNRDRVPPRNTARIYPQPPEQSVDWNLLASRAPESRRGDTAEIPSVSPTPGQAVDDAPIASRTARRAAVSQRRPTGEISAQSGTASRQIAAVRPNQQRRTAEQPSARATLYGKTKTAAKKSLKRAEAKSRGWIKRHAVIAACLIVVLVGGVAAATASFVNSGALSPFNTTVTAGPPVYYGYVHNVAAASAVTCTVRIQNGADTPYIVSSQITTVSQLLADQNISTAAPDSNTQVSLNHGQSDLITDGMTIQIDYTKQLTTQQKTVIPFKTVYKDTNTLTKGTQKTVTQGSDGYTLSETVQTLVNGTVTDTVTNDNVKTVQPVDAVVERGTKAVAAAAPAPSTKAASTTPDSSGTGGTFTAPDGTKYHYLYKLTVTATAYGTSVPALTASGLPAKVGVIAVDPDVIPLLSKVYVTGSYGDYGVCTAADTGSAIKGDTIDIYMATMAEEVAFGRRIMTVYVLG